MVMAPPTTRDSAGSPCFHGCRAFLHRYFPPWTPPSYPLNLSLCNQQQPPPWDCSTIPKLQFPATAPSRGSESLFGVCIAAARTIWFSFHLGCCFTLSLKCFSSDSDSCPDVGIRLLLQFPHLLRAGPVLLTLLFFPFSSFIPLSFASFYIFFSACQVLLSALSWCSVCTCVWRCIPDVSMERDILHVHLLLCHLVLSLIPFLREERLFSDRSCTACTFLRTFGKSQAWIPGSLIGAQK